jgi:phage-related protein
MAFEIDFYSEKVKNQVAHTKSMGSGLFEIRLKGTEGIAGVFYCSVVDCRIVMRHSFVKESQDTPPNELEIARTRLLEVKRGNV